LFKVGENIFKVSNSLDPGEMPSYSVSHLDPSCLHMALGCDLQDKVQFSYLSTKP